MSSWSNAAHISVAVAVWQGVNLAFGVVIAYKNISLYRRVSNATCTLYDAESGDVFFLLPHRPRTFIWAFRDGPAPGRKQIEHVYVRPAQHLEIHHCDAAAQQMCVWPRG